MFQGQRELNIVFCLSQFGWLKKKPKCLTYDLSDRHLEFALRY